VNRAAGIVWVTVLCAMLAACGGGGSKGGNQVLTVAQTTLSFSAVVSIVNDPAPAMVNVTNTGMGGALNFTATSDSSWLMVSPASGTTPGTLTVTALLGSLAAGTYTGHITVTEHRRSGISSNDHRDVHGKSASRKHSFLATVGKQSAAYRHGQRSRARPGKQTGGYCLRSVHRPGKSGARRRAGGSRADSGD